MQRVADSTCMVIAPLWLLQYFREDNSLRIERLGTLQHMERKTYSGCNRTVSFDCFYGDWLWNMKPVLTQKQFTGENRLDTRENCILHRYFSITFPDHPRSQSNHSQHVQLNMRIRNLVPHNCQTQGYSRLQRMSNK